MMAAFCNNLDEWLKANETNVAAIHCKAGKGRTGLMICCWLIHSGQCANAEDAMDFFGGIRTADGKVLIHISISISVSVSVERE